MRRRSKQEISIYLLEICDGSNTGCVSPSEERPTVLYIWWPLSFWRTCTIAVIRYSTKELVIPNVVDIRVSLWRHSTTYTKRCPGSTYSLRSYTYYYKEDLLLTSGPCPTIYILPSSACTLPWSTPKSTTCGYPKRCQCWSYPLRSWTTHIEQCFACSL